MLKNFKRIFIIGLIVSAIVLIAGVYYIKYYKDSKIKNLLKNNELSVDNRSEEERFQAAIKSDEVNGIFGGIDKKKTTLSMFTYNRLKNKNDLVTYSIDSNTIFSNVANDYKKIKTMSSKEVGEIKSGAEITIYYNDTKKDSDLRQALLVQIIDNEEDHDFFFNPSPDDKL